MFCNIDTEGEIRSFHLSQSSPTILAKDFWKQEYLVLLYSYFFVSFHAATQTLSVRTVSKNNTLFRGPGKYVILHL